MPRAVDGTYETPSNSVAPAVAATTIDPDDFNALITDMETGISETVYTSGMTGTDNLLTRTDGINGKKVQASVIAVDDSGNMSGIGYVDIAEIAAPSAPSANIARLYCVDDAGTTRMAFKDSAGAVTTLQNSGSSYSVYGGATNVGLAVSAGSSALTIALKGADGNDPSGSNIVSIPFRSATATTGTVTTRQVSAATSLVLSSGSTLGVTSTTAFRVWIVAFDDAGTVRLGAVLASTYASSAASIMALNAHGIASSTAEGGAGAADSAQVFYTGTAVTSKPYTILGYAEWTASGLTAGTWTTTNLAKVQVYGPGVPLPSEIVQTKSCYSASGSSYTGTTFTDVTGSTIAITPTAAANFVRSAYTGHTQAAVGGAGVNTEVFTSIARAGTAVGPQNTIGVVSGSGTNIQSDGALALEFIDWPNSASSVSYTCQHKGLNASGANTTNLLAGIAQEIMT